MKKKNKNKIKFTIKADVLSRNELHFEIQKTTRAHVFKDKTKYTRKTKHKNRDY